ncbi:MAG: FAD-dependent oxidoreductase [Cyanobacteria bacterium J06581_3]
METIAADILVVGGGVGGSAAAIQAARRGAVNGTSVVLVSDLPWLGGMLTSAGVSAPDGNELAAFQTGLWGEFLKELRRRHPEGLDQGWVSFFTYNPAVGAAVFKDWVAELPNLKWIANQPLRSVLREGNVITGAVFEDVTVRATITLDGTELGDVLALGEVPYRWGWETQDNWNEPSAPVSLDDPSDPLYAITQRYPVQSPTWVVVMEDYTPTGKAAPRIERPACVKSDQALSKLFEGAWKNYGDKETSAAQVFLGYGRLPGDRFMINWPHQGNDYGVDLHRLVESAEARAQYGREAQQHSQAFACFIQQQIGDRYGLAQDIFPKTECSPGGGFALMPYYRESRRLIGLTTVSERDILPAADAQVAALPVNAVGEVDAIALGNYPNDHHYPGFEMPLAPKAIHWGGRWTGTPFTIPYRALVPQKVDGLLACEKNISVSHIANGATRLQPVVFGIGQAAGMAAALCIESSCRPRALNVRKIQTALVADNKAPAVIVPLLDIPPDHPQWKDLQHYYLDQPGAYPSNGHHLSTRQAAFRLSADADKSTPKKLNTVDTPKLAADNQLISVSGVFSRDEDKTCRLHQNTDDNLPNSILLVTIRSEITEIFIHLPDKCSIQVLGSWNSAGKWLLCKGLQTL